jgi:hypothetical protein
VVNRRCTGRECTDQLATYREIGGVLVTSASALFLFVIAFANLIVLRGCTGRFAWSNVAATSRKRRLTPYSSSEARLFKPLFRFVSKSWHFYPICLYLHLASRPNLRKLATSRCVGPVAPVFVTPASAVSSTANSSIRGVSPIRVRRSSPSSVARPRKQASTRTFRFGRMRYAKIGPKNRCEIQISGISE